jgi:hypothetical protein
MKVTIEGERSSHEEILEQLREIKEDVVTHLYLRSVNFDGPRVRAMIDVFRRVARLERKMKLSVWGCSGSMGVIVKEAFAGDSVSGIYFFGEMGEEHERLAISSELSLGMRFRQLESVFMCDLIISREQAEHLGDGLVTAAASNGNLKRLHFARVSFQDEAMSALVSGLRQNSTLQIVKFENCGVTDAQVS